MKNKELGFILEKIVNSENNFTQIIDASQKLEVNEKEDLGLIYARYSAVLETDKITVMSLGDAYITADLIVTLLMENPAIIQPLIDTLIKEDMIIPHAKIVVNENFKTDESE